MHFASSFLGLASLLVSSVTALPAVSSSLSSSTGLLSKRTARNSPPSSSCLVVRGSGTLTGEYSTVSSALSALGTSSTAAACIFIYAGTYSEQITVQYKGALTIYGQTGDTSSYKHNLATLTYSKTSTEAGTLDASSVANIKSSNFAAYNINFINSHGAGTQAVAVTANGNKQAYYGCQFKGYQDTLYAKAGDQYYSKCLVVGSVDYIFGDASAWFSQCDIQSNGNGYITAMSRETASETTWYVFDHCNIAAASGYTTIGAVYLGRPWRVLARVIYQYSTLSKIINAQGWTTMAEGATHLYYEYQNTGDGASTASRKYLTSTQVTVSMSTIWPSSGTSWYDSSF